MKQFYLTEIITIDKLVHQGIYYEPAQPSDTALLWVHGLTSTFYAGQRMLEILTEQSEKTGIGFAVFNNRGHDFVTGGRKSDKRTAKGYKYMTVGSGNEVFTKCIEDIDAGISFLEDQGFRNIILAGASTGANKVCYYAGKIRDNRVKGIVLMSPISDRLVPGTDPKKRKEEIQLMRGLIKRGKGDELLIGHHFFPITPVRYLSLYLPDSEEDVFDYGNPDPKMKYFYKIKKPLLVTFGSADEARDRPIGKIKKVFDSLTGSMQYKSIVIMNASHNYIGKELELAEVLMNWIQSIRK